MNAVAAELLFTSQLAGLSPRLLASRGWELVSQTYPLLEVVFRSATKSLLLRMHFDQWNALPPSVELLTPERKPLDQPLSGGIFNSNLHPLVGRPFICMAGTREYHTHSSHLGDSWESYRSRSGYDLGGIIHQIWCGWLKGAT